MIDRRQFLAGAAGAAAALLGGRLPRAAAAGATLSPARRAAYRRLVAALREAPGGRFDHAAGGRAFAAWYASQPERMRRHADTVLDAASELLPARYLELRDLPGGASPDAQQAHRRGVLMAAVALVEGPGDERAPTDALA